MNDNFEIGFLNLYGEFKSIILPKKRFMEIKQGALRCDGSSVGCGVKTENSDIEIYVDQNSTYRLPNGRTLVMAQTSDKFDARKQLSKLLENLNYKIFIGTELEFFLFDENDTSKLDSKKYFSHIEDKAEKCLMDIIIFCENSGIEIEAVHHECAKNQYELDFRYDSPLKTADNIIFLKYIIKYFAKQNGLVASFMPKPLNGESGSGMHTNISVFEGDKNLFYDKNGKFGLSEFANTFIQNVLNHIGGLTALSCPNNNSYKRLNAKLETPAKIAVSPCDRTALIRIPKSKIQNTRIEFRLPDISANPYLLFVGILKVGFDVQENFSKITKKLPKNLEKSINLLKKDKILSKIVPKTYFIKKLEEYETYVNKVTNLDFNQYFDIWLV